MRTARLAKTARGVQGIVSPLPTEARHLVVFGLRRLIEVRAAREPPPSPPSELEFFPRDLIVEIEVIVFYIGIFVSRAILLSSRHVGTALVTREFDTAGRASLRDAKVECSFEGILVRCLH